MNILYSIDENYSEICLASIRSLLENNIKDKYLKIYIIENKIKDKTKKKIQHTIKDKYKRECIFISCEEICKELKKNNNFPVSAYARLFIQDSIKENRIIYIDSDTIITNNLSELWQKDLQENWIAGVQDLVQDYLKEKIQMNKEDRYINSGVLLIDLNVWRNINFKQKVIEYIKECNGNVVHHDQGIINSICKGKILYLEPKFNLLPEMIMMNEKQLKKLYKMKNFYLEEQLEEARKNPYIIHYICKFYNRPWFNECTHPYKSVFLKYYKGKIESNPLNLKIKIRKFIFVHFPFEIYNKVEFILDYRRKILKKYCS